MALIGNQLSSAENNSYRVLDNLASFTLTFDGSSSANVLASTDTIALSQHPFITGQRVTYSSGGGSPIGGLLSGTAYYITKTDQNSFQLATSYVNAITNVVIDLVGPGTGVTHSFNVAFDGINTKFKATYSNGTKCSISRAAQLDIAINGVIQQPYDSNPPPNGFTIEADATIVFSIAPLAGYTFWGKALSGAAASFETSDNSIDNFTGNGSTTNFTLSKTPANSQNVLVTINGVTQYPSDATGTRSYSVNANVLAFTAAPSNGSLIQVRYIGFAGATSSSVTGFYGRTGNVILNSSDGIGVGTAKIGTGAVGVTTALLVEGNARITGILTIGTSSITLDGINNIISGVDQTNTNNTTVLGIATFTNGPVIIGTSSSTGTASQRLQVTGGAYVSGNLGIGTTNPTTTLQVAGTTKVETSIGSTQSVWFTTLDSKSYSAKNVSLLVSPEKAYFHDSSLSSSTYEPVVVSAALTTNNESNLGSLYTLQNFTNVAGTSSTARIFAIGNANSVFRNSTTDISSFTSNILYGSYNQVAQGSNVDQSVVTGTIITNSNLVNVVKATATNIFGSSNRIIVGNTPNYSANSTNVYNSYMQGVVGALSGTGIGTVTNLYSYYADASIFPTGRVSNYYGLYLATPIVSGTLTNRYSLYSSDTSSPMYHAGSIGIGITNPSQKLEVVGGEIKAGRVDSSSEGGQVSFGRATDNATGWYIDVFGNTSTPSLRFVDVSNSAVRMTVDGSGNLLINRTSPFTPSGMSGSNVQSSSGFSVTNGTQAAVFQLDRINFNSSNYYVLNASSVGVNLVNGATSWAAQSDERFKTDLVPIDNGLEKISTLRSVTGRYISDDESVSRSFLIAQDVQKVLPEAVSESDDEDKTLTLRYQEVIPLLVSALKESKERIEALEEEVQTLKSRINN